MKFKKCIKCNKALSVDNYTRNAQSKDGLSHICVKCVAEKRGMDKGRVCTKCLKYKEYKHFHKRKSCKVTGRNSQCKSCVNLTRRSSFNYNNNMMTVSLKKYGIKIDDYDKMYENQGGKCAICETRDFGSRKRPCIDHCHESGEVRGLLCSRCNTAIGMFDDNTTTIKRAIDYLEEDKSYSVNDK